MKYKLNVKLILSYLFIAFLLIGIIAVVTNVTLEKEFKSYVMEIQSEKNQNVVDILTKQYKNNGHSWDKVNLEEIGMESLGNSLIIKVKDENGNILWDAMQHNSGMCAQMLAEMAHNMKKYYPGFEGKYTDKDYNLKLDNISIGTVTIGYYGPYYFSEKDIAFLRTLNNVLFITAVVLILISIFLGTLISRKISKNITRVIRTTKEIAAGNYKNRINEKSDTKEIIDLIDSVNDLAITLDHQEQLRKELTSDIAHELRTPIATLQSHLEALRDGVWKLTPDRIDSLYEEIIRLSKIVKDLDKLTSYDSNRIELKKADFNILKLSSTVVTNMEADFNLKNINVSIEGDNAIVNADKDKITQVLINLLSNALKYTNKNGEINITVKANKDTVKVTVKDSGIGISEADLPYIFERFYRADKSRTRSTGGSGIGLSIVKNIIEAHHGRVKATSVINKGTSIIFELPR